MKNLLCVAGLIFFTLANLVAAEDSPKDGSEISVAAIKKMGHDRQASPFGTYWEELRAVLLVYVDRMRPEFTVCTAPLAPLERSRKRVHRDLWMDLAIGSGLYLLDHPEDFERMAVYQMAGLEWTLKTYENMKRDKPKFKHEHLEKLLGLRDAGKLEEYFSNTDCGE